MKLEQRLYTLAETATILGVHRSTIYNWKKKGIINILNQVGDIRPRVAKEEIERLLGLKGKGGEHGSD